MAPVTPALIWELAQTLRSMCKLRSVARMRTALEDLADILDPPRDIAPGIGADTLGEEETGPENSREEVVGTATRGKSANAGNSGYSGGPIWGYPLSLDIPSLLAIH